MGKSNKGKELGKGIDQRPDGSYRGRFTDSNGVHHSINNKNLNALKEEMKRQKELASSVHNFSTGKMTVREWYNEWTELRERAGTRQTTLREYDFSFCPLPGWFKNKRLMDVTPDDIQAAINHFSTHATQSKTRKMLAAMFNTAENRDYIRKTPVRCISIVPNPNEERQNISDEHYELFMNKAREENCKFVELFILLHETGMRLGECLALTWNDIIFKDGKPVRVGVNKTWVYYSGDRPGMKEVHRPKTKSSTREIPLTEEVSDALLSIYKGHTDTLVFESTHGEHVKPGSVQNSINILIRKLRKDGYDFPHFTAHCFRHTFATRCVEKGVKPKVLQKWMGHSSIKTTLEIYTHVTDEGEAEELRKIQ